MARMMADDRSYATDCGFYLGDSVELPDGRKACIDEIVAKRVHHWDYRFDPPLQTMASVVRLDDELWLDVALTRIA